MKPEGRGLNKQPGTRRETWLPISRGVSPSEGKGRGSSCLWSLSKPTTAHQGNMD